mgnify:CR=1 FL=1
MMNAVLDARRMNTRAKAHAYLAAKCGFPAYYGSNLDAAFDLLSTAGEMRIILKYPGALEKNLGDYGLRFLEMFTLAAQINANLVFEVVKSAKKAGE